MNEKTDVQIQTGKGRRGMAVIAIVVLAAVLCFVLTACGASINVFCVGRDAAPEAITAFYSTEGASPNPPYYRQFRFQAEGGKYFFAYEVREGSHWPLTEKDVTSLVEKELSAQEWAALLRCLEGGTLTNRAEDTSTGGSGPWLYLYWTGDPDEYQVFAFADYEKAAAFESLCAALTEG